MLDRSAPTCAHCHAPLPEDAIDRTLGVAQCPACGEVSEIGPEPAPDAEISALDQEVEQAFAPDPAAGALRRQVLADVPAGWREIGTEPTRLQFVWASGGAGWWVFAGIWNLFVLAGVADNPGILCSPFAWFGFGMLYYAVARTVNRTELTCDGRTLTVWHGPVPLPMHGPVEVGAIAQLFVTESPIKVNQKPLWNLKAKDGAGREHVLLRWVRTAEEARWVEAHIEATTGLVDRPVPGEADRDT